LFFMVTAYLFWSRLLRDKGRPAWRELYIGRVFRIAPLYLLAFVWMASVALYRTGFHLEASVQNLASSLLKDGSLGFFTVSDINGYWDTRVLLDGVVWTLQYEWYFYLSLPLLALAAARARLSVVLLVVAMLLVRAAQHTSPPHAAGGYAIVLTVAKLFLCGMITGSLLHLKLPAKIPNALSSTLVVLLIPVIVFRTHPYSKHQLLLMCLVFYLVASGCTVFGLLTSRSACRLGDVSYGIYLLQGIPHTLLLRAPVLRAFVLGSPAAYWFVSLLAAILLLFLATFTHVWIERPGIALGKRIIHRIRLRSRQSTLGPTQAATS
jgi:peptidoglycan/LPS O-acetylase OafA/YrhL